MHMVDRIFVVLQDLLAELGWRLVSIIAMLAIAALFYFLYDAGLIGMGR